METELIFKSDAKALTDMMFDGKLFRNDLTRDDLNMIEEYINYCLSARLRMREKIGRFTAKLEKLPQ